MLGVEVDGGGGMCIDGSEDEDVYKGTTMLGKSPLLKSALKRWKAGRERKMQPNDKRFSHHYADWLCFSREIEKSRS